MKVTIFCPAFRRTNHNQLNFVKYAKNILILYTTCDIVYMLRQFDCRISEMCQKSKVLLGKLIRAMGFMCIKEGTNNRNTSKMKQDSG